MTSEHMCISMYGSLDLASEAVATLRSAGFNSTEFSLIGRDVWAEAQDPGLCFTGSALIYGGSQEVAWERIWSAIPGRGGFWFFDDGPLLVAGRMADTLAATPEVQMAPAGTGLVAALSRIGVPQENLDTYASEVTKRRLILIVHGSLEATDRAHQVLSGTKGTNHTLHHGASK